MSMSCFLLQPVETSQPQGDKYELDEYFTSQIVKEIENIIYNQVRFTFPPTK